MLDERQEPPVHVVGDAPGIGKLVTTPEGTIVWKTTVTAGERLMLSTGTSVFATVVVA